MASVVRCHFETDLTIGSAAANACKRWPRQMSKNSPERGIYSKVLDGRKIPILAF